MRPQRVPAPGAAVVPVRLVSLTVHSGRWHCLRVQQLPLPTWLLEMCLLTRAKNRFSVLESKRHMGVSCPTVWLPLHKNNLMLDREQWSRLTGRVKIYDAYLGVDV